MNLLRRFYSYQDERFPFKVLIFTTMAVVLSSAAILSYKVNLLQIILSFAGSLAYLFHIRVIDESRDFRHDSEFHPDRPVQRGLISLRELMYFNIPGLLILIAASLYANVPGIIYGGALLVFSFFAWRDFFAGQWLKKKFYLYNAVNMLQMVLLQLFIYAILTNDLYVNDIMWIHLLFVIFNTILMEFVRKIKTGKEESKGKDTYSWHMGFLKAILTFSVFAIVNFLTLIWLLNSISPGWTCYQLVALVLLLLLLGAIALHIIMKKKLTEGLVLLGTVLNYVGLNMIIYFFNI